MWASVTGLSNNPLKDKDIRVYNKIIVRKSWNFTPSKLTVTQIGRNVEAKRR